MERTDAIKKVNELMEGSKICMLATISGGQIVSRPMAVQAVEFDGDLWFFVKDNSDKVHDIQQNPEVNVAFDGSSSWVSLSGRAEVVRDRTQSEALWHPRLKAWFPGGVDEPNLALLKINATSAEYWDSKANKLVNVFGAAKAAVTGERARGGENKTVQL